MYVLCLGSRQSRTEKIGPTSLLAEMHHESSGANGMSRNELAGKRPVFGILNDLNCVFHNSAAYRMSFFSIIFYGSNDFVAIFGRM